MQGKVVPLCEVRNGLTLDELKDEIRQSLRCCTAVMKRHNRGVSDSCEPLVVGEGCSPGGKHFEGDPPIDIACIPRFLDRAHAALAHPPDDREMVNDIPFHVVRLLPSVQEAK